MGSLTVAHSRQSVLRKIHLKDQNRSLRAAFKMIMMLHHRLWAGMAELVDAGDLKSPGFTPVRVRVPLPAPPMVFTIFKKRTVSFTRTDSGE